MRVRARVVLCVCARAWAGVGVCMRARVEGEGLYGPDRPARGAVQSSMYLFSYKAKQRTIHLHADLVVELDVVAKRPEVPEVAPELPKRQREIPTCVMCARALQVMRAWRCLRLCMWLCPWTYLWMCMCLVSRACGHVCGRICVWARTWHWPRAGAQL